MDQRRPAACSMWYEFIGKTNINKRNRAAFNTHNAKATIIQQHGRHAVISRRLVSNGASRGRETSFASLDSTLAEIGEVRVARSTVLPPTHGQEIEQTNEHYKKQVDSLILEACTHPATKRFCCHKAKHGFIASTCDNLVVSLKAGECHGIHTH